MRTESLFNMLEIEIADNEIQGTVIVSDWSEAEEMWEYHRDLGGCFSIDGRDNEYQDDNELYSMLLERCGKAGVFNVKWIVVSEKTPANWTGPTEYDSWIEIISIEEQPQ